MGYGFNDNTYTVLKRCEYRDVFLQVNCQLNRGEDVGSAIANAIIVTDSDRAAVRGLEGNPYIDKVIELGYIELKA